MARKSISNFVIFKSSLGDHITEPIEVEGSYVDVTCLITRQYATESKQLHTSLPVSLKLDITFLIFLV